MNKYQLPRRPKNPANFWLVEYDAEENIIRSTLRCLRWKAAKDIAMGLVRATDNDVHTVFIIHGSVPQDQIEDPPPDSILADFTLEPLKGYRKY